MKTPFRAENFQKIGQKQGIFSALGELREPILSN